MHINRATNNIIEYTESLDLSKIAHDLGSKNQAIVIADSNTQVFSNFPNTLVLEGSVIANNKYLQFIENSITPYKIIIGLGGGTITDLCKYSALRLGKRCIIAPTCASMNGYASGTASITIDGHKQSFNARAAEKIYCDINIIADAPLRLTLSGVADLMCRSTVEADWLLSHYLTNTTYDPELLQEVRVTEKALLSCTENIKNKHPEAIKTLMEGLIQSGEAMRKLKSSACASQGEHMIAHLLEMCYPQLFLHGEAVALATRFMLQHQHLPNQIKLPPNPLTSLLSYFGHDLGQKFYQCYQKKDLEHKIEQINSNLSLCRANITEQMQKYCLQANEIFDFYEGLGINTHPIIPEKDFEELCRIAFATRDRFTFLDILASEVP